MPNTKTIDIDEAIKYLENESSVAWSMYLSTGYAGMATRATRLRAVQDLLEKLRPYVKE